jgi:hypothetical protein
MSKIYKYKGKKYRRMKDSEYVCYDCCFFINNSCVKPNGIIRKGNFFIKPKIFPPCIGYGFNYIFQEVL